jgi:hypothetical protein
MRAYIKGCRTPAAIFGPVGFGLRQGLLGAPARIVQGLAPFLFGIVVDAYGTGALLLTVP